MAPLREEPVVFSSMLESFEKCFPQQLRDPKLRGALREVGVNFDKLEVAYRVDVWERAIALLAATFFPGVPSPEQLRRTGHAFVNGFSQLTIGKAAIGFAKVVGIKRTLMQIGRSFRTGSNYTEEKTVEVAPRHIEMRATVQERFRKDWPGKSDDLAFFTVGVIEEMLDTLGARSRTVELLDFSREALSFTIRVQWT